MSLLGNARSEPHRTWMVPAVYGPLLLASALFGFAITFDRGAYAEGAMTCVFMGLAATVYCYVSAFGTQEAIRTPRTLIVLLWIGLLGMAWFARTDLIVIYAQRPWSLGEKCQTAVLLLLLTYLPFLTGRWREPKWLRLARFAIFAALVAIAGVDAIHSSPHPRIDVWTVQQAGARALHDHLNPYVVVAEQDSGPTRLPSVPYIYPPTQLYLTLPAFLLGHDVRYTMLVAVLIAGLGIRYISGRTRRGVPSLGQDAPALFLWLTPKLFFIIEQASIDPVQIMLIVLVVAAHIASLPMLAAVLLGVTLSAKQTMFWAVLLIGLILRFKKRHWAVVVACATALVLPFAALNFRALKYAMWGLLESLPSRPDALTFNNWFLRHLGVTIPGAVGFVLAAVVIAPALWRFRGSRGRLGVALVTTYALFFSFNRWAFANYYFMVASLAALGAALASSGPDGAEQLEET